jgi:hypothetical protein
VSDSDFDVGLFGVFIASVHTPGLEVRADDVAYWSLP